MSNEPTITGILFFYTLILIGMVFVSIHYRKKYEELREWIKLMKEIGEIRA